MTKAIYRARDDGDYDFVAAFNEDELPDAPCDWPEEICVWFGSIGENCIVVRHPLELLPEVLDGDSLLAMNAETHAETGLRATESGAAAVGGCQGGLGKEGA